MYAMRPRIAPLAVVLLLCCPTWVEATNTFFLPGDAFFHFRLDAQLLKSLEEETPPVFVYNRPRQYGVNMCGYAGFPRLEYHEMPQGLRDNLVKLTRRLRATRHPAIHKGAVNQEREPQEREINPFHVLLYNDDFDEYALLGLKLNDRWNEHTSQFETFVPDGETPARIRQFQGKFKELQVEVPFELVKGQKPDETEGDSGAGFFGTEYALMGGPRIEEPVIVRGARKFVLIPSEINLKHRAGTSAKPTPYRAVIDVSRTKPGAVFYVVTEKEVVGYRSLKRKWVPFSPYE